MKKTCCILCVLLLAVVFTSCGLESKAVMKNELHAMFPDAVITDIQEDVPKDEFKYNDWLKCVNYTVKNHDVTFTVSNFTFQDTYGTSSAVESDYAEKLLAHFKPEIAHICEKYNVTSSIDNLDSANLVLYSNVNQLSDVDNGLGAMKELLSLLEPYLPTEAINERNGIYDFDFNVVLESKEAGGKVDFISCSRKEEFNFENEKKCLRFTVVNDIKSGECSVSCTQEELDMYPPSEITALKIDGVPFTSDRYPIEFAYNILSEEYGTIWYGTNGLNDNGEVDHLQQEIIQSVYPQSNYVFDEEKDEITYNIGKDQYLIKETEESGEDNRSFEFYRNGKRLNIETNHEYISVEDFAELMGMKVDSIDNDCICLSVK